MKRRNLVVATAAMVALPGRIWAARPCPPPQVSLSGGSSVATSCGNSAPATSYSTTFSATENPVSEGGAWVRNTTTYFHNARTTGGNLVGAANAGPDGSGLYDDCYSHLTGAWSPNQEVVVTVYKGQATGGEIEIHLRASDTASSMSVYECLFNVGGGVAIVRWNGTPGNITYLAVSGLNDPSGFEDGDRARARIVGQTIDFWYARKAAPNNWLSIGSVTDNSAGRLTSGNPGVGFFTRSPASLDYGIKDFSAVAL